MLRRMWLPAVIACACILQGCSVCMIPSCASDKDYQVPRGTPRAVVLNTLGVESKDVIPPRRDASGRDIETYKFKDGLPLWSNILRGVGYAAADVFTLCLWEVVGTPLEYGLQKGLVDEMVAEVKYDAGGLVDDMKVTAADGEVVYDTATLAFVSP